MLCTGCAFHYTEDRKPQCAYFELPCRFVHWSWPETKKDCPGYKKQRRKRQ